MSVSVSPLPTKLAAAFVAAGVVSVGSVVALPANKMLPTISADVANASVVTDALYSLGDVVNGVSGGFFVPAYGALSLPFDAATAIGVAAQNPSLAPNVLSWLVQRYVNPSDDYPNFTYPWDFKTYSLDVLAGTLPSPLNEFIVNGANQIANAINAALSGLPDATPGEDGAQAFWATDLGKVVSAGNNAVAAPAFVLYDTAYYLGYLPADLEATLESAFQNPTEIPGLVSSLVYGLLSPQNGLFGDLLYDVSSPLTVLPGPIGELATTLVNQITVGVNNLLASLPAPIDPTPFPSASVNASLLAKTSPASVSSLPEASVTVPSAITLRSTSPAETPSATTALDADAPQDLGAAENSTPQPAASTANPGTDSESPTNVVRSGNKVKPGDKFAVMGKNAKGKDKEDGTAPATTGSGVEPGTGAGATNPQDGAAAPGDSTTTSGSAAGDAASSSGDAA